MVQYLEVWSLELAEASPDHEGVTFYTKTTVGCHVFDTKNKTTNGEVDLHTARLLVMGNSRKVSVGLWIAGCMMIY